MASPDISKYIDLTTYDLQPSDIYDAAIEYAQNALPEWSPTAGSIEDAVLQAASSMTAYLVAAINRLPAGNIEGLLRLFGVERNSGTAPTASVNIQFIDASTRTIPSGTRFGYLDTSESEPVLYVFETTQTLTTSASNASATIEGISLSQYPAIASGTELQLLSAVSSIQSVTLTTNLSVGANPESQTEFVNRAIAKFAALSESLATTSQFANFALTNFSAVYRATAVSRLKIERDLTAITRSSNSVTATTASGHSIVANDFVRVLGATDTSFDGYFKVDSVDATHIYWSQTGSNASAAASAIMLSHVLQQENINGYAAVYVSDLDGASLSATVLAEIENDITDKAIGGLVVRVDNAKVANIGITANVTLTSGNLASTVSTDVKSAIETYLNPNTWGWGETIYVNELIALVDRVVGVDRVVSISLTDTDNAGSIDGDGNFTFDRLGVLPLGTATVGIA